MRKGCLGAAVGELYVNRLNRRMKEGVECCVRK